MLPLIRFLQHTTRLCAESPVFFQMPYEGHYVGYIDHHNTRSARRLSASDNSWLVWRKSSSVRFDGLSFQRPCNCTTRVGHFCSSAPQSFRLISLICSSVRLCVLLVRRGGFRFF